MMYLYNQTFYRKLLLLTSLIVFNSTYVKAETAVGVWETGGGLSHVEIFSCGEELCGRIVWLLEPNEEDGTPKLDNNNEIEDLQKRPLMGLELISGFIADDKPGRWVNGTIYNPEDGKTYQCTMKLKDDNTLQVRGYVLLPILGKTQTWSRLIE